ncbi:tape measure domain-containing protein [Cruoricaptor ignavus]|uniref:Tape measure domain-containing protein n=1 Tax=Cruoricaptor ignavus TaxID=1118202 RepID=A0A1M6G7M4_9FLAO|nr:tape measure protein [Cruoricaptor ignavus]SHJ05985.1 tape measure domain-containing protein [Cruoricaptor ignavus]
MSALDFEALLKTQDFEAGIKRIQDDIRRLTSNTEKDASKIDQSFRSAAGGANELDRALKKMQAGLAAYFSVSALKSFADQVINIRGEFQKTEIAFATMLGSGEKAKSLMNDMVQLAAKTPFSLQDVSNGAKQLLAFQVPAEEVVDTLTRMGNIAAGLSVPIERINLVYGQVKAKGRLMGDDLRQFTEAGIPMVAELAKKFDTTTAAISKMVSEGKIGFNDVKDVLFSMTDEGGMFFNLMEKQSASLSGRISNLGDAWDQMLNKIGEANEGILNDAIEEVTYLVEHYEGVIQVIEGLVVAYGAYRAALIVTSLTAKVAATSEASLTAVQQLSTGAKIAATEAQKALNATILANPYALAMAALAGLLYVIYNFTTQATLAEEAQERMNKRLSEAKQTTEEQKAKIESLVTAIKSENTTNEERERLLKQIHTISNGRLSQLSVEAIRTGKATAAINDYVNALDREARAKAMLDIKADNYKKIAELELKKEEYKKGNYKLTEAAGSMLNTNTYRDKNGKVTGASIWAGITDKFDVQLSRIADAEIETYKKQSKKIDKWVDKNAKDVANSISKSTDTITNSVESSVEKNKEKTKNAARTTERQLAEIYPKGSIKELQERAQLIQEAVDLAVDDKVKLRGKDKYGDHYLTGEVISMQRAYERIAEINEQIRRLQSQSLEERINEAKRQIEVRDKLLQQGYSKESVDEMFPEVKDKTFESYLKDLQKSLENVSTAQAAQELARLQDIIDEWQGNKTFIDGINEGIEKLKKQFEGEELISRLEELKKSATYNGKAPTESQRNEADKIFRKAQEEEIRRQQDAYDQMLKDQQTFLEKQKALDEKYARMRSMAKTDLEKAKIEEAYKKEAGALASEMLKASNDWSLAFGNLEGLSRDAIERLIKRFEEFRRANKENLSPSEIRELNGAIERLKRQATANPFRNLINSIRNYAKANEEAAQAKQELLEAEEEYNKAVGTYGNKSEQAVSASRKLANAQENLSQKQQAQAESLQQMGFAWQNTAKWIQRAREAVNVWADAFGGLSEAAQNTMDDIFGIMESLDEGFQSYMNGDVVGMVLSIVKSIGLVVKALNGEKKKERQIKQMAIEVNKLKTEYEALGHAVERALGSNVYAAQQEQIKNLQKQLEVVQQMRKKEDEKKKTDKNKLNDYDSQILSLQKQIEDIQNSIVRNILQTDAKDAASKLGDALVDAFSRGEDASKNMRDVANNMIKDIVKNALKMRLETAMKPLLDSLLSQMGFDEKGVGSFKGLSPEQIKEFQNQVVAISQQQQAFLEAYQQLFQGLEDGNLQGLKGAIQGVTEKTAGGIEAQMNAMRVNQVSGLEVMRSSLLQLSQIEANTRNLIEIRKDLKELNQKTKQGLAGI